MKIFKILYFISVLLVINLSTFWHDINLFVTLENVIQHKYIPILWNKKERNLAEGGLEDSSSSNIRTHQRPDLLDEEILLKISECSELEYMSTKEIVYLITDNNKNPEEIINNIGLIQSSILGKLQQENIELTHSVLWNMSLRIAQRLGEIFRSGPLQREEVQAKLRVYIVEPITVSHIIENSFSSSDLLNIKCTIYNLGTIRNEIAKRISTKKISLSNFLLNNMMYRISMFFNDIFDMHGLLQ
ncbi:hypothetical protein PRELSG_1300100 [Plasmodium relictum]|uniref:Uncharacterized protein n=1 Tax=Plasmodium relictum TaxID=85471 RepID=A0A1J1HCJ4_PLARL|nr:hypothetical protein PRELSG_1300100 [Plasmodium relictum]CRH03643.1 hypothetical protein PRELSG_1300100 [Plasmodium relictum]